MADVFAQARRRGCGSVTPPGLSLASVNGLVKGGPEGPLRRAAGKRTAFMLSLASPEMEGTMRTMPKVGDIAPDFVLKADDGSEVRLSSLRGRKVVLYFYPKDMTPGCTAEACEFRDHFAAYEEAGAVILGVSPDDVPSHVRFKSKYGLPFRLLSDPEHRVCELYGVWGEKQNYGRTYMGVKRTTLLIGEDGRVARVFESVKPKGHAELVLEEIR